MALPNNLSFKPLSQKGARGHGFFKKRPLLPAGGGFADDDLLGDDLAVDLTVTSDVLQKQTTGRLAHEMRLVLDGRELGSDVLGMDIIGEADQGHIIGDSQTQLLDGGEGGEGDDVVEGEDGIRTIITFQQTDRSVEGPFIADAVTDH